MSLCYGDTKYVYLLSVISCSGCMPSSTCGSIVRLNTCIRHRLKLKSHLNVICAYVLLIPNLKWDKAILLLHFSQRFRFFILSTMIKKQLSLHIPQHENLDFWIWVSVSRPLQPVPGRKFHVDFESAIKNSQFLQPEGKCQEKRYL